MNQRLLIVAAARRDPAAQILELRRQRSVASDDVRGELDVAFRRVVLSEREARFCPLHHEPRRLGGRDPAQTIVEEPQCLLRVVLPRQVVGK
jgi:hypothetical protein